jgi:hypothetical protein
MTITRDQIVRPLPYANTNDTFTSLMRITEHRPVYAHHTPFF